MTARTYRLLCNGAEPGRELTADEARVELERLPVDSRNVRGDLVRGISWTVDAGAGQTRRFTITSVDEEPS